MKELVIYLIIATLPNGKNGLIDLNGEIFIPFEYPKLYHLNSEYLKAQNSNGFWGVVDINNNIIIPFEYQDLGYLMNFNLLPAKLNNKWGIINQKGENVLPFEYDRITDFDSKGTAFTIKENFYGLIDSTLNELIPNQYKRLTSFREDISMFVDSNDIHGCINSKNEILFRMPKEYALEFAQENIDKKIINKENGGELLKGVVDLKGNILIEPKYNSKLFIKKQNEVEFIHGINACYENGEYEFELFINQTKQDYNGKIRSLDYNYGRDRNRTVISVESNGQIKFGVIDPEGLIVVPIDYQDLKYLRVFEGDSTNDKYLILAQREDKYGIIDENEHIYLDYQYPRLRYLNDGYYRNDVQNGTLLFDKEGQLIIEDSEIWYWFQIEEKPNFFFARDSQNNYGVIDLWGNWAIRPVYKNLGFVREYKKL